MAQSWAESPREITMDGLSKNSRRITKDQYGNSKGLDKKCLLCSILYIYIYIYIYIYAPMSHSKYKQGCFNDSKISFLGMFLHKYKLLIVMNWLNFKKYFNVVNIFSSAFIQNGIKSNGMSQVWSEVYLQIFCGWEFQTMYNLKKAPWC